MSNNYSISDVLNKLSITKDNNKFEYDLHDFEFLLQKKSEWKKILDKIDIKFIENYIREKKLLNLKNEK